MTDLDLLCRETVESAHMPRVMVGRFLNSSFARANSDDEDCHRRDATIRRGFDRRITAKLGGDNVDRSASARPSGQLARAQPQGVDCGVETDPSGPEAKRAPHSNSEGAAIGAVNAQSGLPDADSVDPAPSEPHRWASIRPHCLNPDACAGSGRNHCFGCRKLMKTSEAA